MGNYYSHTQLAQDEPALDEEAGHSRNNDNNNQPALVEEHGDEIQHNGAAAQEPIREAGSEASVSPFSAPLNDLLGGLGNENWITRRVVHNPPKVHTTKTVKCEINLLRETLRLVPMHAQVEKSDVEDVSSEAEKEDENEQTVQDGGSPPRFYQLQFNLDCSMECKVKVFFAATEKRDEENRLIGYDSPPPKKNKQRECKDLYVGACNIRASLTTWL